MLAAGAGLALAQTNALSIVEAGQMTVQRLPQLDIQREQINISRGYLLEQQGAFDLNLTGSFVESRAVTPLLPGVQSLYGIGSIGTNTTGTTLGATQQFRSGITIAPSVQLNRTADNYSQIGGVNQPTVGIQVTLPLLRNRGREAVAAPETAAGIEVQASVYDLNYVASQALANTAVAYWNYLGAIENVALYRGSEQRSEQFLENVRAMAAADVVPRIQVEDALADVASRRASRIGAEQGAVQAQQQLAIAAGLPGREVLSIGQPSDPLPEVRDELQVPTDNVHLEQLIDRALKNRADYLSAKLRSDEERALTAGARNHLRPQLDVIGSIGYVGIRPGGGVINYLGPLFVSTAGPNASIGVQYQFPRENRAARGELIQDEAALRQNDLRAADAARQIASGVVTAAFALNNAVLQYKQARAAEEAASSGREGESERLRQGVGSVLDVLQTEDRYISAVLARISAQVAYAERDREFPPGHRNVPESREAGAERRAGGFLFSAKTVEEPGMSTQIYRSAALARMCSPDQLDQLVRVTSAKRWIRSRRNADSGYGDCVGFQRQASDQG